MRRGRLVAYEPQTYAGYLKQAGFRLRLPLTIYNTGAKTLAVTNIRAVFLGEGVVAPVITFCRTLKPIPDDVLDFAHPFPVAGRQADTRFVEFGRKDWSPEHSTEYEVAIEIKSGDRPHWTELVRVTLTSPDGETGGNYIAHRRDPADDAPPATVWSGSE